MSLITSKSKMRFDLAFEHPGTDLNVFTNIRTDEWVTRKENSLIIDRRILPERMQPVSA